MPNLKQLIKDKKTVWAAGAFDALSARLIQEAGFDALLTSGYGISSSFLGEPDTEFYTMTENLAVTRNVCNAVTIPVIADIDTAYGNAVSAMRTMREFENAGAVGGHRRRPGLAQALPVLVVADRRRADGRACRQDRAP